MARYLAASVVCCSSGAVLLVIDCQSMITVSASGVFANYLTFQSPPNTSHFLWSVLLPTTSFVL